MITQRHRDTKCKILETPINLTLNDLKDLESFVLY